MSEAPLRHTPARSALDRLLRSVELHIEDKKAGRTFDWGELCIARDEAKKALDMPANLVERCREEFDKAGYWPNEVLWKAWQQAWAAALASLSSVGTPGVLGSTPVSETPFCLTRDNYEACRAMFAGMADVDIHSGGTLFDILLNRMGIAVPAKETSDVRR